MKLAFLSLLSCLFIVNHIVAINFYLHSDQKKCFLQTLAKDTTLIGHFDATQWSSEKHDYWKNPEYGIRIIVELLPNRHPVIDQKASHGGKFSFTSAESGSHQICLTPYSTVGANYTASGKVQLNFTMGVPPEKEQEHKQKISALLERVKAVENTVSAINSDQVQQMQSEMVFRDMSEAMNSNVVYWAIADIVAIGLTCVWQLYYLKNFFKSKKLV